MNDSESKVPYRPPLDPQYELVDDAPPTVIYARDATYVENVRCVEMPCCGLLMGAEHIDHMSDPAQYSCPECARD